MGGTTKPMAALEMNSSDEQAEESSSPKAAQLLSTSRRRKCRNTHGDEFSCAERDHCCGDVCVGQGGHCCKNVTGNFFPCGEGGGCCGNACFAAGSKWCISVLKPKSQWYPVTKATKCASGFVGTTDPMSALQTESSDKQAEEEYLHNEAPDTTAAQLLSTSRRRKCRNTHGAEFSCAARDHCCGDICVGQGGHCCRNVDGNFFPCGKGGGCCGNACFAAGSKCCISTFKPKSSWYPVTADTECASGFFGTTKPMAALETEPPSRKQTVQEH